MEFWARLSRSLGSVFGKLAKKLSAQILLPKQSQPLNALTRLFQQLIFNVNEVFVQNLILLPQHLIFFLHFSQSSIAQLVVLILLIL